MAISSARSIPLSRRANKADVAGWFGVSLVAVDGWIRRGCPAVQQGKKGTPWVFDLLEVAEWRFSGKVSADDDAPFDPERLSPTDRRAWYEGEDKRISIAHRMGDLVTVDEYRDELARILKPIADCLETLPDVLERKCGLPPDAVIMMQAIIDEQRAALADRLTDTDAAA